MLVLLNLLVGQEVVLVSPGVQESIPLPHLTVSGQIEIFFAETGISMWNDR